MTRRFSVLPSYHPCNSESRAIARHFRPERIFAQLAGTGLCLGRHRRKCALTGRCCLRHSVASVARFDPMLQSRKKRLIMWRTRKLMRDMMILRNLSRAPLFTKNKALEFIWQRNISRKHPPISPPFGGISHAARGLRLFDIKNMLCPLTLPLRQLVY